MSVKGFVGRNEARLGGGLSFYGSSAGAVSGTVAENRAFDGAGAYLAGASMLEVAPDGEVSGNVADGGGVDLIGASSAVVAGTVSGNSAAHGGDVNVADGSGIALSGSVRATRVAA